MHDIYRILKRIGVEVRKKADRGHKLSMDLISWYKIHHRCPADPGAQAVVTDLTLEWCSLYPKINLKTYQERHKAKV
jgi:hypothetical protein